MPRHTPDDILELHKPTTEFLCPLSANTYGIDFKYFSICDYDSKRLIFEVGGDAPAPASAVAIDYANLDEMAYRQIKYDFSEDVLKLPTIQTSLVFSVGGQELEEFRMIERHYFRDQLIKSYDFTFGFVIPNSTNTWDAVYALPPMDDTLIQDMVDFPYESTSDSFYFVGDELVMHNKAKYKYHKEDAQAQEKGGGSSAAGYKGSKGSGAGGKQEKGYKSGSKSIAFNAEAAEKKWSKEDDYSDDYY